MSITVKDGNGNSQTVNTLPGLGQAASANSLPVVIASDQGTVPTTQANNPVGSASGATSQASIGTVTGPAATIVAARTGAIGVGRIAVTLFNAGTQTVFYGFSNAVTTSTGARLLAGAAVTINTTSALYGVSASGTNEIDVTETY